MSASLPDTIRPLAAADRPAVAALVTDAFTAEFGRSDEAALVQRLREAGLIEIELVAERDGAIAGHIVFSRLQAEAGGRPLRALALAPVSVRPGLQRGGLGGRLIAAGHDIARRSGFEIAFVLGHPAYYPRFGYRAELAAQFAAPFRGPHFMARWLAEAPASPQIAGHVVYPPPFGV